MSFGVISLNQPTANTDGTIAENFIPGQNLLVVARGSFLQFFRISKVPELFSEYQILGNIIRVIPIRHPSDQKSNLLVITSDFRFSVLRFTNEIRTVQSGSINCSYGVELDPPFKITICEKALIIQITTTNLQYYRISSNSQLMAPFTCTLSCKNIICTEFMQIDDNYARIAVLMESFGQTKIQVYETDELQQVMNPKSNFAATVEQDAYLIRDLNESTVLVFSTSSAKKIHFLLHNPPHQTSSTINTQNPIQAMIQMR